MGIAYHPTKRIIYNHAVLRKLVENERGENVDVSTTTPTPKGGAATARVKARQRNAFAQREQMLKEHEERKKRLGITAATD